jgi:hypothetical protein
MLLCPATTLVAELLITTTDHFLTYVTLFHEEIINQFNNDDDIDIFFISIKFHRKL